MTWTPDEMLSMDGERVVITGANSGLGYEAAKTFARKEATVVMACRSLERGTQAAETIRAERPPGALDVRECDLADLNSVAAFADGLEDAYDGIDILCNNAGIMAIPREETEQGFEMQLGVNHLGHFALTGQLFELLLASEGEARVVTHSSSLHEQGEMDFDDLNWEQSYSKWGAYGRSKLANLLFAYELQRRVSDTALITSVACHPGYADTNLQGRMAQESGRLLMKPLTRVANTIFAQSAERGAWPMLYAATADIAGGAYVGPGGLFDMRGSPEIQSSSEASMDEADARTLWEYSEEATGVSYAFDTPGAEMQ